MDGAQHVDVLLVFPFEHHQPSAVQSFDLTLTELLGGECPGNPFSISSQSTNCIGIIFTKYIIQFWTAKKIVHIDTISLAIKGLDKGEDNLGSHGFTLRNVWIIGSVLASIDKKVPNISRT